MARGGRGQPLGRSTLGNVRRQLAQGFPAGLTVLTGDDLYHLDAALHALLEGLVPREATEFGLTVFDGAALDVGTAVDAARSAGMFSPRRVVLVRDASLLEGEPEPLLEFAKRPPPHAHLLVRAPQLDRRRKLHQALATAGKLYEFGAPQNEQMTAEVKALAAAKDVKIEREALEFLAALCAGDLYRVDAELEKLRVWSGRTTGAEATLATLGQTAAGAGILSGWAVADAVLARDVCEALTVVRGLSEAGEEGYGLVGALAYRARGMLRAKALIEGGVAPEQALRQAGLWGAPAAVLARGLARYTLRELLAFPATLLRADRDLKLRRLPGNAVLEEAVETMIGGGAA